MHPFHHDGQDWDAKDPELDYREAELRDDWNHQDRHHDWNPRYDHKWLDHEEGREGGWNHYPRRPPHEEWNNDWPQEGQQHGMYPEPEEERMEIVNQDYPGNSLSH